MTNICRALIWAACFLELSDDETIDPDSAVKALEDLSATLQQATEEERAVFSATCTAEAERLETEAGPEYTQTIEFIRSLPKSFGW